MNAFVAISIFSLLSSAPLWAEDCSRKFPSGEFGIPQSDPIAASGKLFAEGLIPLYMEKQRIEETPEVCRDVYAFDVFRLTLEKKKDYLYAGCYGDFNHDGVRDYVLLFASAPDRKKTQLKAFIHTGDGYRAISLGQGGVMDDGHIPYCIRRPSNGIFRGLEGQEYKVPGDLVTYGWFTYFWENNDLREILTSD